MSDARLRSLMEQVKSGALSRNKQFDAFQDPKVRRARERAHRLDALNAILLEVGVGNIRLERERDDIWRLSCWLESMDFLWTAYVYEFELELLAENQATAEMLNRLNAAPVFA